MLDVPYLYRGMLGAQSCTKEGARREPDPCRYIGGGLF